MTRSEETYGFSLTLISKRAQGASENPLKPSVDEWNDEWFPVRMTSLTLDPFFFSAIVIFGAVELLSHISVHCPWGTNRLSVNLTTEEYIILRYLSAGIWEVTLRLSEIMWIPWGCSQSQDRADKKNVSRMYSRSVPVHRGLLDPILFCILGWMWREVCAAGTESTRDESYTAIKELFWHMNFVSSAKLFTQHGLCVALKSCFKVRQT